MYKKLLIILLFIFSSINFNYAISPGNILLNDSFEDGDWPNQSKPVWGWRDDFNPDNRNQNAPFGEGSIYSVSSDVANSGSYSLRLNFEGNNNICNLCGAREYEMAKVDSPVPYFINKNTSQNTSLLLYSNFSNPYVYVYNYGDYYSKWKPVFANYTHILFENDAPVQNDWDGVGEFDSDDNIYISRICGLDDPFYGGNVASYQGEFIINRRSDCNQAINYLKGDKNVIDYNETLAKRFYFYIPNETKMPGNGIKLSYATFTERDSIPKLSGVNESSLNVDTPFGFFNKIELGAELLERDTWYYIEEVFYRESGFNKSDGSYELYFGKSGDLITEPIARILNGGNYGNLTNRITIIGNWQHSEDAIGSFYIDDVMIAKERIGPSDGNFIPQIPKPILSVDKNSIDFSSAPKGFNRTQIITLENIGTDIVQLYDISSSGNFVIKDFCGSSIDLNENCEIKINFNDMSLGEHNGMINISSNGNGSNFFSIPITAQRNNLTLDDLLITYLDFENYSLNDVYDISKYEKIGTIIGNPTFENLNPISPISGEYITFDGANDYISFPDINFFNFNNSFTILFWVNQHNSAFGQMLGKSNWFPGGGHLFSFTTSKFSLSNNFGEKSEIKHETDFPLNTWVYITGVYDGNSLNLYLNGSLVDSVDFTGDLFQTGAAFTIGATANPSRHFNGSIDEVRIYNFSLSGAEVYTQYLKDLDLNPEEPKIPDSDCGNGAIDINEVCDGTNLNSKTCESFGFDTGFLSCNNFCNSYDNSSCEYNPTDKNKKEIVDNVEEKNKKSFGGGSGGDNIFSVTQIENITLEEICFPDYNYLAWSVCQEGKQTQFIEDLNDCEGDIVETRQCKAELSDEENLLLNAKQIELTKTNSKNYKASLDTGYNEIFYVEEKLEDSIFLFEDETTGQEYYGQYYDSVDDKHYYTLKRVDEGIVTILQEEGILDSNLIQNIDNLKEDGLFYKIVTGLIILVLIGFFVFIVIYVKKRNKNNT